MATIRARMAIQLSIKYFFMERRCTCLMTDSLISAASF
nr:MAG TPA: hypothetical protein [Caudoviricetes sp.]